MDLDLLNANLYTENRATEFMYNKFLKSHPHIFKHVKFEKRPATKADYFIPESLAHKCIVTTATFTETGCQKIACFPKMQNLEDCDPPDESRFVLTGSQFHLACQPACSQISKELDAEFRNGKCMMVNPNKKVFAMFPEKFEGSESPVHQGLDIVNGNLMLNEKYCGYYGLNFENGDCVMAAGQEFSEFIISETAFRSIKRKKTSSNPPPPPPIPNGMKNVHDWMEGHVLKVRKKRSLDNAEIEKMAENIAKGIAIDVGVDMTLSQIKKTLGKRIPKALLKMTTDRISKTLATNMIKKAAANTALNAAKAAASAVSVIGIAYSIYSVISMTVDIVDPFDFSRVLSKTDIGLLNKTLDFEFFENFESDVEVEPSLVWELLEEDESDLFEHKRQWAIEYLKALNEREKKEIFIPKRPDMLQTRNDIFNLATCCLILLAFVFVDQIGMFSFVLMILAVVIPPLGFN